MKNKTNMTPAYVLSGHTMALGVVRALGERGVPVIVLHYDQRDTAHLSRYATHSVQAPHPEKSEREFIALLTDCVRRFGHGVVFPVSDESVVAVAGNKEALERHFIVACPDRYVVDRFIDKKITYALAETTGVPAPKTAVPSSVEDVERYGESVEFPCLVKPCQSHLFYERFQRKMVPVNNLDQMVVVYRQAAAAELEVMLQEIIPGGDEDVVNYNAYFCDGKPAVEFTARHVRNAPPLWGSPRVALSEEIPEVIEPGRRILQAMGFDGYACTEFKRDSRDGVYKLMEVNGRHNLSTLLAVRCGINFPWLHYRHLAQGEAPSAGEFRSGVYWIDITRDLAYSLKFMGQERCSLRQYLRPYMNRHVFAIFDRKDPMPFVKRWSFLTGQALRSLTAPLCMSRGKSRQGNAPFGRTARVTLDQVQK